MQSNHTSVRSRWGEKPYYSLDYYLKETFGQKVYKIALDAGMTCPNRDEHWTREAVFFAARAVPVILPRRTDLSRLRSMRRSVA